MADGRVLTGVVAAAVVAGAAAGAVALWPAKSSPGFTAAGTSTPAPRHQTAVDGIPDGSRVAATGLLQRDASGARLCLDNGMVLDAFGGGVCSDEVHLRGPGAVQGMRNKRQTVIGTWQAGEIVVSDVRPPKDDEQNAALGDPPCPQPPGGWAHLRNYSRLTPNLDSRALEHYQRSSRHALTAVAFFRPEELHVVLTVASTDPAATRAALGPSYPDALCVVASKHSWGDVHSAIRRLDRELHSRKIPGLYELGQGIADSGQPVIMLGVRNDRAEVDAAVRGMPKDLIQVHALIRILGAG